MRLFLPILLKKAAQKAAQSFNNQQQSYHTTTNTSETFQSAPNRNRPRETKKVGEYVDFEEID